MTAPVVYLNGKYLPADEACVPVLDRGFIFGDGVYEVIPVYARRPFRLEPHLQRLENSLQAVRIDNPFDRAGWQDIIDTLIERNDGEDQSIYLQVTRGIAARDHKFPSATPTVFVMSNPLVAPAAEKTAKGVEAITLEDIRWQYCNIKSIALLPNILLRQQAVEQGAAEAILLRDGKVTEGAASNVFVVVDDTIVTPPKSRCILPGITRDLVVELAHDHGLPCEERDISETELRNASEIWLTSSTKEILPVTHLDGRPVGDGKAGPVWQKINRIYQAFKSGLQNPGKT